MRTLSLQHNSDLEGGRQLRPGTDLSSEFTSLGQYGKTHIIVRGGIMRSGEGIADCQTSKGVRRGADFNWVQRLENFMTHLGKLNVTL